MRNGENEQKLENINHCVCCVICHYSPVLCAVMSDCVISYIYIVVILFCLVHLIFILLCHSLLI